MRKKIVFLPYDMDTAIGINNEGALVFRRSGSTMKALSSSAITWRTSTRPQAEPMCSMGSSQFFGRT